MSPAPLGVPFPYGIPGKGLGWGGAFSPIAAGLKWSESSDPAMEGTWAWRELVVQHLRSVLAPPGDMGLHGAAVGLL